MSRIDQIAGQFGPAGSVGSRNRRRRCPLATAALVTGLEETEIPGARYRFQPAMGVELSQDSADVIADRRVTDAENIC